MVLGRSDEESDPDDRSRRQLVADMKQRFPDCSVELILELTYEHHQNAEIIADVLMKRSGHFQNEPQTSLIQGGSIYPSHDKHNQNTNSQGVPYYRHSHSYYPTQFDLNYHRYSYTDELPNPQSIYLQRRAISTDRLTNRRPDVSEIRRERSASDVTHIVDPLVRRSPLHPTSDPSRIFVKPQRTMFEESFDQEDDGIIQHIQLQKESLARMQAKVNALRSDVARILDQVSKEEQDLNTRSKVQKNPTEKDVEKLRQENEKLRKEVMDASTKLERIREGMNSGSSSPVHVPTPPLRILEERPAEPFGQHVAMNEFQPSFSPKSGPRFPHPHANQNLQFPLQASDPQIHHGSSTQQLHHPAPQNPIGDIADSAVNDTWSCPDCTFENHPDLQSCEICQRRR